MIWPLLALLALVAARRHLDVVEVRGRSMAPTLLAGDRLLVARLPVRVGDVVLASDPRAPQRELIKRVASADDGGLVLRGDNPAFSTDARTFGALSPESVRWRVVARYWPAGRIGRIGEPPTPAAFDFDRCRWRAGLHVSGGADRRRPTLRSAGRFELHGDGQ